ncbi:MAG: Nif11-like leader peptide family natural product precursor [Aphanocapsa sp. GSE-SYN-MK-11-07L]|jgi:predicted ribosomally synthesized peptide with nif11-like leader|nr:Nif11-like leader peptide family natural product precursor [Aphanocapsa sp. GSE-SYN-MK-11-07L]
MAQDNAARWFKAVQQDQASQERQKALSNPETFVQLAASSGYSFTVADLQTQINRLSDEEIAAIFNPGLGPRRHLTRR